VLRLDECDEILGSGAILYRSDGCVTLHAVGTLQEAQPLASSDRRPGSGIPSDAAIPKAAPKASEKHVGARSDRGRRRSILTSPPKLSGFIQDDGRNRRHKANGEPIGRRCSDTLVSAVSAALFLSAASSRCSARTSSNRAVVSRRNAAMPRRVPASLRSGRTVNSIEICRDELMAGGVSVRHAPQFRETGAETRLWRRPIVA
jgi:hypothetical protein